MREGAGRISNSRYRARQMRQRSVVADDVTADDGEGNYINNLRVDRNKKYLFL